MLEDDMCRARVLSMSRPSARSLRASAARKATQARAPVHQSSGCGPPAAASPCAKGVAAERQYDACDEPLWTLSVSDSSVDTGLERLSLRFSLY